MPEDKREAAVDEESIAQQQQRESDRARSRAETHAGRAAAERDATADAWETIEGHYGGNQDDSGGAAKDDFTDVVSDRYGDPTGSESSAMSHPESVLEGDLPDSDDPFQDDPSDFDRGGNQAFADHLGGLVDDSSPGEEDLPDESMISDMSADGVALVGDTLAFEAGLTGHPVIQAAGAGWSLGRILDNAFGIGDAIVDEAIEQKEKNDPNFDRADRIAEEKKAREEEAKRLEEEAKKQQEEEAKKQEDGSEGETGGEGEAATQPADPFSDQSSPAVDWFLESQEDRWSGPGNIDPSEIDEHVRPDALSERLQDERQDSLTGGGRAEVQRGENPLGSQPTRKPGAQPDYGPDHVDHSVGLTEEVPSISDAPFTPIDANEVTGGSDDAPDTADDAPDLPARGDLLDVALDDEAMDGARPVVAEPMLESWEDEHVESDGGVRTYEISDARDIDPDSIEVLDPFGDDGSEEDGLEPQD